MKHYIGLFSVAMLVLISSCTKEQKDPAPPPPPPPVVAANFTATVTGVAPNATITIVNNSTGADTYGWTFSAGGSMQSSNEVTPAGLTVDKKGDFSITLVASKGTTSNTMTKAVNIGGTSAIFTYTNIKFGVHNYGSIPYCYSVSENKFYQRSEITTTTGPTIDLVFYKDGINSTSAFLSPHNPSLYPGFSIPGARITEVINHQSPVQISPAQFDGTITDEDLAQLNIVDDNSLFLGNSQYLPQVKLFKTATGRKGAIKIKAQETDHLLVDIKVQKY